MEAVRVLKQTGLKKVRPFICPARRLVLPPEAGVRVTVQSSTGSESSAACELHCQRVRCTPAVL